MYSNPHNSLSRAIDQWVRQHRDELVHDLMALIRIPSVAVYDQAGYPMGQECKRALDHFLSLGQKYGFQTENGEDHWGSLLHQGNGERELGILGHLDVVAAGDGWKFDPFDPIEANGFVTGRGSSDNKGPLVMGLYVLRCMKELGIRLKSDVRLIAGCDEEREMRDVSHYVKHHAPPAFTLNCDGAWAMCIGEKGILIAELSVPVDDGGIVDLQGGRSDNMVPDEAFAIVQDPTLRRISAQGVSAHCATPSLGSNAIRKLFAELCTLNETGSAAREKLRNLYACIRDDEGSGLRISYEDRISGKTTCVPTMLRFENGTIHVRLNIRYAIGQSGEQIIKRLQSCGMHPTVLSHQQPRLDSPDDPRLKILLDTCQTALRTRYKPYVMGGGTHSRIFPDSIPFGPLVMNAGAKTPYGHPHGPDEAVKVDDLLQAIKVYILTLKRLDSYFDQQK